MSDEETATWESRREKVRKAYQDRLQKAVETMVDGLPMPPETTGVAPSADAPLVDLSDLSGGSARPSTVTSVTDTDPVEPVIRRPSFTMPAWPTSSSSSASTVWTVSPLGWIDSSSRPSIVEPNGSLVPGLSLSAQSSLRALATGRAESLDAIVLQIAEFFVEAEDERAEGPLGEAIEFYIANYHGGGAM